MTNKDNKNTKAETQDTGKADLVAANKKLMQMFAANAEAQRLQLEYVQIMMAPLLEQAESDSGHSAVSLFSATQRASTPRYETPPVAQAAHMNASSAIGEGMRESAYEAAQKASRTPPESASPTKSRPLDDAEVALKPAAQSAKKPDSKQASPASSPKLTPQTPPKASSSSSKKGGVTVKAGKFSKSSKNDKSTRPGQKASPEDISRHALSDPAAMHAIIKKLSLPEATKSILMSTVDEAANAKAPPSMPDTSESGLITGLGIPMTKGLWSYKIIRDGRAPVPGSILNLSKGVKRTVMPPIFLSPSVNASNLWMSFEYALLQPQKGVDGPTPKISADVLSPFGGPKWFEDVPSAEGEDPQKALVPRIKAAKARAILLNNPLALKYFPKAELSNAPASFVKDRKWSQSFRDLCFDIACDDGGEKFGRLERYALARLTLKNLGEIEHFIYTTAGGADSKEMAKRNRSGSVGGSAKPTLVHTQKNPKKAAS